MGFFFKTEEGDKIEGASMILSHSHKKLQRLTPSTGYYHCQAATETVKKEEDIPEDYTFTSCRTKCDKTWGRVITEIQCEKCKAWACGNHWYEDLDKQELICCRCMWELSRKAQSKEEKDDLFDKYTCRYHD